MVFAATNQKKPESWPVIFLRVMEVYILSNIQLEIKAGQKGPVSSKITPFSLASFSFWNMP